MHTRGKNELMRSIWFRYILLAALLLLPDLGLSQAPGHSETLTVKGYPGKVPVIEVHGKSYVEIEALARLTKGSITFRANQIILTLPASASNAETAEENPAAKPGFSRAFLRAGIEEMMAIREWRAAIADAIQNNFPVMDAWVTRYRRAAENKLALASTEVVTDSDRSGDSLLGNEFNNMEKLSDKYLALHNSRTYISPDSVDNDRLNQQILDCADGLAALAVGSQFQDVSACH